MGPAPRSWWLEEALAREPDAASVDVLEGRLRADVCVVGGGYTGLWTALRLRELDPSLDVVVVEGGLCGEGASGRNGGFALSWWPKIETLIKRVGRDDGFELARASEEVIAAIGAFCEREGIDAHFHAGGWAWTATSPAQLDAWRGAVATCEAGGARPFEAWSAQEARERLGSPVHLGAVYERGAATVQPALLARGLRAAALRHGVRVLERSPMRSLDAGRAVVRGDRGEVAADAVVLATNAWSAQAHGLRTAIVPLSSDVVATEPIPEVLERIGWTGGEAISNSRLMVDYYRTTRDGRIVFGRGGGGLAFRGRFGTSFDWSAERTRGVTAALHRLVPAARDARITHAWGGAVDRSHDGLPFLGRLRGGAPVFYCAGFSGNGVAPSALCARVLASLALERDDESSRSALARGVPGRFPPEPARYVGGRLVRAAVQRKEALEDDGRHADPVTRHVAALAPSGFFKVTPDGSH